MEAKEDLLCNADYLFPMCDSNDHLMLSPKSQDSCYDSDSSGIAYKDGDFYHSDVSRTSSDTPSETFSADYEHGGSVNNVHVSEDIWSSPGCRSKIDFVIKLGYTSQQVRKAVAKCGPNASENDLLSELVQLEECEIACDEKNSDTLTDDTDNLRPIIIDGSNVAMCHGNNEEFSCRGIKEVVQWFQQRGHRQIIVFVPQWRKETSRPDSLITDQEILYELEKQKLLVFTPSRRVDGKRVICDDDRYIVKEACQQDGIIVSNDFYRELKNEKPEYKRIIEKQQLMYSFVAGRFSPPDDPLGKHGPTLDTFLAKSLPPPPPSGKAVCPYLGKCTYGNKCKYYHPDREVVHKNRQAIDKLLDRQKATMQGLKPQGMALQKSKSAPTKKALTRTESLVSAAQSTKLTVDRAHSLAKPVTTTSPTHAYHHSSPHHQVAQPSERKQSAESAMDSGETARIAAAFPSPSSMFTKEFFESGHLALAKKLSDEDVRGCTLPKEPTSRVLSSSGTASPLHRAAVLGCSSQTPNIVVSRTSPPATSHPTIARQLTLLGPEDQRLSQRHASNDCMLQALQQAASSSSLSGWNHQPVSRHVSDPCYATREAQQNVAASVVTTNASPVRSVQYSFGGQVAKPQALKPSLAPAVNSAWMSAIGGNVGLPEHRREGSPIGGYMPAAPQVTTAVSFAAPVPTNMYMHSFRSAPVPTVAGPMYAAHDSQQSARRDLFCKLATLFDPVKVNYVMSNYPEELSTEVLCRHILDLKL